MHRFRGAPWTYEWLELTAGKVARSVLRGRGAGNGFLLPDENNNILKTQGYNLEHNFGHGERFLANTLASLNILSFLLHTAQEFWDPAYRTVRSLMPRGRLFQLMTTLTTFFLFESFDQMMEGILSQGEVRYRLIPDTRSLVLADDTSTVVNEWRPSRVLTLPVPPARGV